MLSRAKSEALVLFLFVWMQCDWSNSLKVGSKSITLCLCLIFTTLTAVLCCVDITARTCFMCASILQAVKLLLWSLQGSPHPKEMQSYVPQFFLVHVIQLLESKLPTFAVWPSMPLPGQRISVVWLQQPSSVTHHPSPHYDARQYLYSKCWLAQTVRSRISRSAVGEFDLF